VLSPPYSPQDWEDFVFTHTVPEHWLEKNGDLTSLFCGPYAHSRKKHAADIREAVRTADWRVIHENIGKSLMEDYELSATTAFASNRVPAVSVMASPYDTSCMQYITLHVPMLLTHGGLVTVDQAGNVLDYTPDTVKLVPLPQESVQAVGASRSNILYAPTTAFHRALTQVFPRLCIVARDLATRKASTPRFRDAMCDVLRQYVAAQEFSALGLQDMLPHGVFEDGPALFHEHFESTQRWTVAVRLFLPRTLPAMFTEAMPWLYNAYEAFTERMDAFVDRCMDTEAEMDPRDCGIADGARSLQFEQTWYRESGFALHTCAMAVVLLKPELLRAGPERVKAALDALKAALPPGAAIVAEKTVTPSKTLLRKHYAEHRGKPFFQGLITRMHGPCKAILVSWRDPALAAAPIAFHPSPIALAMMADSHGSEAAGPVETSQELKQQQQREQEEGHGTIMPDPPAHFIKQLRSKIGPTDPKEPDAKDTLRGQFGFSKKANSFHCSDSPVQGAREVLLWFPEQLYTLAMQGFPWPWAFMQAERNRAVEE
jgi:nucleoside diphosphate kinase